MSLKITRNAKVVSVTDGKDMRAEGCKSLVAAEKLETRLKADLVGARRWMKHREPEQLELPLVGGTASMWRRVDED